MTGNSKSGLRKACWQAIRDAGAARFPGVEGRIPNFVGAEAAAERLATTDAWQRATVLKCNPDSPQRAVRRRALDEGKLVFMAVPRLRSEAPFLALDPSQLDPGAHWAASSIKGADAMGIPTTLDAMPPIDLIVTGCVGVTRQGARLGKGGGYSDLEYALLREHGKVGPQTPVATTVHASQVLRAHAIPMRPHDVSLDLVVTPERTIRCKRAYDRPAGILWDALEPEKQAAIPVLAAGP
jgi:5-formyltetrahydrofolate cyclo-ligase